MDKCTCNNTPSIKIYICFQCGHKWAEPMDEFDTAQNCPIHKIMMMCGSKPILCNSCITNGWVAHGGDGGPIYIKNSVTGDENKFF